MVSGLPDTASLFRILGGSCIILLLIISVSAGCDCSSGSSDSRMDNATKLSADGLAFLSQGRYTEAIESYNTSISLDPYSGPAWYGMAVALYSLGRYPEAKRAFERVTVLSPADSRAWYYIGNITARTGSLQSAVKAYDRAIAIQPGYKEALKERETVVMQVNVNRKPADLVTNGNTAAISTPATAVVTTSATPPARTVTSVPVSAQAETTTTRKSSFPLLSVVVAVVTALLSAGFLKRARK